MFGSDGDGDTGVGGDPVAAAVARVEAALDALTALDVGALRSAECSELVAATALLGDRFDAARSALTDQWDARRCWADDGARSGQAWLRNKLLRSGQWAGREVHRARKLRHLPHTAVAFAAGRISADHVTVLAGARNPRSIDAFTRDEELLVGYAERLRFDHFERAVKYWLQHADPDGAEQRAAAQHDDRSLHHSRTLSGMWHTDGVFDPVVGAEINAALRAEADRLFREEWAAAKHALDAEPGLDDLTRTPAQRRADALANLIRRGHGAGPDGATPAPLVNVVVGLETITGTICELLDGTVITPGQLAVQLTEADIRRVVFDGPDRVLSVGARSRFFRGALRDAIVVRDRECRHDLCDISAEHCDIDHVVPWPDGPSNEPNGQALCDHHNRAKGHTKGTRPPSTWYRRPAPRPRRDDAADHAAGDEEPPDH